MPLPSCEQTQPVLCSAVTPQTLRFDLKTSAVFASSKNPRPQLAGSPGALPYTHPVVLALWLRPCLPLAPVPAWGKSTILQAPGSGVCFSRNLLLSKHQWPAPGISLAELPHALFPWGCCLISPAGCSSLGARTISSYHTGLLPGPSLVKGVEKPWPRERERPPCHPSF